MKQVIGAYILMGSLLLFDVTPALAHDAGRNFYYQPNHHRLADIRRHNMPVWLKRDHGFRNWYRHSSLQRNRNLTWLQLHEIFRWEQSYLGHRYERPHHYYGGRNHRNHDWYRKYWRNKQHRYGRYRRDLDRRHWSG